MSDNINNERLETDLSGMDFETAFKYVTAYFTEYKEIQKKIPELLNEKKIWEDRIKLAADKNKPDLVKQAEATLKEINQKLSLRQNRANELRTTTEILKDELTKLSIEADNQFNAEELILQMEQIAGDDTGTKKAFNNMQVNDEFDKMKKDIK